MKSAVKRLLMEREKERQMAEKHHHRHDTFDDDDLYGRHHMEEDKEEEDLELELSDEEIMDWARRLKNADGSHGPRFKLHEFEKIANEVGARYHSYELEDLWITANMLYSDFCLSLLKICPSNRDEEMKLYANMAMAFLEDEDSKEKGERKLSLYYLCFADD